MTRFVCKYLFFKAQDVPKFIHAIEQAGFIERVDREIHRAIRKRKRLRCKVNGEFGRGDFLDEVEQHLVSRFVHNDRDEAILERVVAEDVREGGGDYRAESETRQRPGSVLAARSTAEVVTG